MRTLLFLALFGAFASAHDESCKTSQRRAHRHQHNYSRARYSYRAYPRNSVQRHRYVNRLYTGRSYLDHRVYGYERGCGYTNHHRYAYFRQCYAPLANYPYAGYVRPYAALAPIYSRYGASLTLDDPIFEREPATQPKAAPKPEETRAGGPPPGGERVGNRFVVREP